MEFSARRGVIKGKPQADTATLRGVLKNIPAKPYFEDVVALTVAVNDEKREKLAELCKLLGYSESAPWETWCIEKALTSSCA